jgi:hypothetical protein
MIRRVQLIVLLRDHMTVCPTRGNLQSDFATEHGLELLFDSDSNWFQIKSSRNQGRGPVCVHVRHVQAVRWAPGHSPFDSSEVEEILTRPDPVKLKHIR